MYSSTNPTEIPIPQNFELLKKVLDAVPMGVVVNDKNGKVRLHVNPEFCHFVGYTREEILASEYGIFTVKEDLPNTILFRDRLRSGELDHCFHEKRYIHKNGNIVWGEVKSHVLRDENGQILNHVSYIRDITEDKEKQDALEASENRFKALIDNSTQGIMLHRNHKALYANPAFVALYGYDNEQDILEIESTNDLIAPEVWDPDLHDTIFAGKEPTSNVEYVGVKKDGTRFWVQRRSFLIDWEGQPTVCTARIDITQRKKDEQALLELASTDPLTGADNRRSFFEKGNAELRRAKRYNRLVAILAMDLDHFKQINDEHGHAVGDKVLKKFVEVCKGVLLEQDILGRVGGEEFTIILPEDDLAAGKHVAERLRHACEDISVKANEEILQITVSIGVIECGKSEETLEEALERADKLLYQAKKAGRNRILLQSV